MGNSYNSNSGNIGTGPIAFHPSPAMMESANLTQFMATWGVAGLDDLRERARQDPAWFWDAVVKALAWHFEKPYRQTLDTSRGLAFSQWFVGGTTNVAHNCLDRHAEGLRRNQLALVWEGEDGAVIRLTYRELQDETNRMANALAKLGVRSGDVVGLYLPMVPEAVVATYAVAKLGAIYVPMFSGYGAQAVATRLHDARAKILICADGFYRRGRVVAMKAVADEACQQVQSIQHMVVVRRVGQDVAWNSQRDHWWHHLRDGEAPRYDTPALDSEHPFLVIYTSGTTGRPKGAVHTHVGFPLKAAQDLAHCFDLKSSDTLFWFTDMGWMMGPWEVLGGMVSGATILLYEGSPDYPEPDRLWRIIERHGVTIFGISPTAIRALMTEDPDYVRRHDLSSLRILGSTGEPWNPDPWTWYFREVGHERCPIINYSGGTEISGGILSSFPILPIKPCSFSGPVPGVPAVVLDEEGRAAEPGTVGELAILGPWPGMTRGFWGDDERYLDAYWRRWPDVWVHGDWAMVDEDGFWYILGRSDDTIKIAGKRLGPAEVESALVSHPDVQEACAVGIPHPIKGEALVCFVVLAPGKRPAADLENALKAVVSAHLGKSLRPEHVHIVSDLPKTRNAKIVRRAVKARYLGRDAGDLSSVENLGSLDEIDRIRTAPL